MKVWKSNYIPGFYGDVSSYLYHNLNYGWASLCCGLKLLDLAAIL